MSGGDELARANARVVELEARLKAESERCAALQVALRVADPSSDEMDTVVRDAQAHARVVRDWSFQAHDCRVCALCRWSAIG